MNPNLIRNFIYELYSNFHYILIWQHLSSLICSWASSCFKFGLVTVTMFHNCSWSRLASWVWHSILTCSVPHVTDYQLPRMVLWASTWSPWVAFRTLTGTPCQSDTRVLAMCSPLVWYASVLISTRPLAASRGLLSHATITISQCASITLSLINITQDDYSCTWRLHKDSSSHLSCSMWRPRSTDAPFLDSRHPARFLCN